MAFTGSSFTAMQSILQWRWSWERQTVTVPWTPEPNNTNPRARYEGHDLYLVAPVE